MIKVLMIDDNLEVCKALKLQCLNRGVFDIDYFQDLESGIAKLSTSPNQFDAVILDGRGYLSADNKKESTNHVIRGIREIQAINKQLPIVIYTGYLDETTQNVKESLNITIPIFEKTKDYPEEMFTHLKDVVENAFFYNMKNKHADLFLLFEKGYLDKGKIYEGFIDILSCIEGDNFLELKPNHQSGHFNKCRMILEHIYVKLSEFFPNALPPDINSFAEKRIQLTGNKGADYQSTTKVYQGKPIENLSYLVNANPGYYGHYIKNSSGFFTPYGFKAVVYALFEIMLWYKNGIETGLFES